MADLSIEEVKDIEAFRSLRNTWNALLEKSADNNVFLTWEWLFTWWRHYGGNKQLRILLVKELDRIIGIAPFMQWQYQKGLFNINILENICAQECDYSGVILAERADDVMVTLLNYLQGITANGQTVVRIWHVPETSDFLTVLKKEHPSFRKSLALDEKLSSYCLYITLPSTWEELSQNMGRKTRKNLRRFTNLLEKDFEVEFLEAWMYDVNYWNNNKENNTKDILEIVRAELVEAWNLETENICNSQAAEPEIEIEAWMFDTKYWE